MPCGSSHTSVSASRRAEGSAPSGFRHLRHLTPRSLFRPPATTFRLPPRRDARTTKRDKRVDGPAQSSDYVQKESCCCAVFCVSASTRSRVTSLPWRLPLPSVVLIARRVQPDHSFNTLNPDASSCCRPCHFEVKCCFSTAKAVEGVACMAKPAEVENILELTPECAG